MIRGVTRKRTGLKPIVVSASTSWLTRIVPISAAKAAPERPASRMAVISGPSSRSIDKPIKSATKISAPKRFIGTADWNARIMPSRNEMRATIGSASAPTCSQIRNTSFQRTLFGWRAAKTIAANVSPMNSTWVLMSRQMPYAARPTSSIAGRRGSSGSRSRASTTGSNWFSSAAYVGWRFVTSTFPSRDWRRRSTNSATPAPSQYSTPAASITSGRRGASAAARRAASQSPGSVVASRRPVNASVRRPSAPSLIASAAMLEPAPKIAARHICEGL